MRRRSRSAQVCLARLYADNPLAHGPRRLRQVRKRRRIINTFDIHADRGHPVIRQYRARQISQPDHGSISQTSHIGHRQRAPLHRHVDHNVRRLRHQRHAAINPHPAMLIWPQQRAVQIVDHAVTVRAKDRHIARRLYQERLQFRRAGFRPARGKANRPARPHRRQLAHDINRCMSIDADKRRIRYARQIGQGCVGLQATHGGPCWMHRPYWPRKPHLLALLDHI